MRALSRPQDVIGVELGGALKNPLAVGAGMIDGSGLGVNTMAAYVTRATKELQALCTAMGGKAETVNGLSGVGDLMLTAFGSSSRNRSCGARIARGEPLEAALAGEHLDEQPAVRGGRDRERGRVVGAEHDARALEQNAALGWVAARRALALRRGEQNVARVRGRRAALGPGRVRVWVHGGEVDDGAEGA